MAARFKLNRQGVGRMLRMPGMQAEMLRRAELIRSIAINLSPVYEKGPSPGRYKASWESVSLSRGGARHNRAAARVQNRVYYARWVEYGTEKVPAHHVLLRAAQAGGRNQ
jgi:hypothetical protein